MHAGIVRVNAQETLKRDSVQPARLQLALLDPQVAREFRDRLGEPSSMKRSYVRGC
jgi:hypothetical protein